MSIEFRLLRYVVAVAEEGGFQRAADRLHMAQPPLSRQIARLERELGVRLFDRRPTRLTAAGEVFVAGARRLLADADALAERTREAAAGGAVRIGYIASTAYDTLPRLLEAVRAGAPGLRVDVREGWSPELERALREQRLDLVLSHSIPPSGDLAASTLRREPLVAVVHARHPLASRSAVALRELRDETFCFLPRALAPGYYDQVVSALHALGEDFVVWEHPVPGLRLPPLRDDGTGFSLVTASAGERLGHDMVSLAVLDDLPAIDVQIVRRAAEDAPCVHRVLAVAHDLARSWAPPAVG